MARQISECQYLWMTQQQQVKQNTYGKDGKGKEDKFWSKENKIYDS